MIMRSLLIPLFLAACTTAGTVHNPACLLGCTDLSSSTVSTQKEIQSEKAISRNPVLDRPIQ
jgi:hypothetical protein